MKLQNLAIIFAIIIIPVSLLLGAYVGMQIDTIKLQSTYDEKLTTAVYDSIKAYQINTANNPYAILNVSQKRDIEAAINTFMNSFATGLGVSGYGENYIRPYVPAILYTLYDGYYIYAPTYNEQNGKYEHLIKPYVTYSQHYKKTGIDVVVSYTLDNYITVIGTIHGEYVNKSGHLVNQNVNLTEEVLTENLFFYDEITGEERLEEYQYIYAGGEKRYYDPSATGRKWFLYRSGRKAYVTVENANQTQDINAKTYSAEAQEFTAWVKSNLGTITVNDLVLQQDVRARNEEDIFMSLNGNDRIFNPDSNDFESENSTFQIHKRNMIKISIRENLSSAIANYNAHSGALGTSFAFQMPALKEEEWDQITKNICMVAFVQGLPVGMKTYNNYAIINNTRNKNYIEQEGLAFINSSDSTYHRIDCPYLEENNIQGYRQIDFESSMVEVRVTENEVTERKPKYYYKHTNLPCYYCIVSKNYDRVALTSARLQALRQVLGRERQMLHY